MVNFNVDNTLLNSVVLIVFLSYKKKPWYATYCLLLLTDNLNGVTVLLFESHICNHQPLCSVQPRPPGMNP